MKKPFKIIVSAVLAAAFALVSCGCTPAATSSGGGQSASNGEQAVIRLRSDSEQSLNVNESMYIVSSVYNATDSTIRYTSTDESVVTVNAYGYVTATGVGTAEVVLSLAEDPTVTQTVYFTVTKTFFVQDNGYYNGTFDISGMEDGSAVYIKDSQTQLLVNDAGETWYFSCHIEHTGYTNDNLYGRWGVGSFLVNSTYAIGDTMFWYGFAPESETTATAVYGGWRYETGVTERYVPIDGEVRDISAGVDVLIMRKGTMHYFVVTYADGSTSKCAYNVPLFEGKSTYPGVFGQNQQMTVTDYKSSSDADEVDAMLETFQVAESMYINVIDARLVNGQTYRLTSTVLPELTVNKEATYSLAENYQGVTLTADGALTLGDYTGELTVNAAAKSNPAVTASYTYTVIDRPASDSSVYETGLTLTDGVVGYDGDAFTVTGGGTSYIPLTATGEKWYVEFTAVNDSARTAVNGTQIGLLSAAPGYTEYVRLCVDYTLTALRRYTLTELGVGGDSYAYAPDSYGTYYDRTTIGIVKDGADYYIVINGKLLKQYTASFDGETCPVLYVNGAEATLSGLQVITDEAGVDSVLAEHTYYVGGYVTTDEMTNSYRLVSMTFGSDGDVDWPPVNDYENGLKLTSALTGDYTIEFTMSDIEPYNSGNGQYDAKVLIYLRSESTTCSLQFIIKRDSATDTVRYAFCCNFDDATWTEYDLPDGIDITQPTAVKVVKTLSGVELYLNGTRVYADESFFVNTGYWSASTVCTPGIGTFRCGVTITDPVITH